MLHRLKYAVCSGTVAGLACVLFAFPAFSQVTDAPWDVTRSRGETREIDFVTEEGTWMSVDVSPDGQWLVFDLLAHIYRIPVEGGPAEVLTQGSGVAVNYHPRFSPDGLHIAFVSDRSGQDNLWIMNADGSDPRPVFTDENVRVVEPSWTPDGEYIVVRRRRLASASSPGREGLWIYHRDGGRGVELVGPEVSGASWPSFSEDGKYLYFHELTAPSVPSGHRDVLRGSHQLRRLELETGNISPVSSGEAAQQRRSSSGGAYAPEVSPDGRWLAFGRRIPDGTISYRGHRFGPRTALWIRDLHSGAERVVMDPIEQDMTEGMKTLRVLPGYTWSPDGRSIFLAQGGQLRRLDVETGEVSTIPFTARVRRTISEQAWVGRRISDGPMEVKFIRWPNASPDGRQLAFHAVGRIWVMDLPDGRPRPLILPETVSFENAPAWSPDGRWIAFTTWHDQEGAHVWKIAVDGGDPIRLSEDAAEYLNPVWSPDGREVVVARGAGATARGRTSGTNPWYELVRIPAGGGVGRIVTRVDTGAGRRQVVQAAFGPEGRIFYAERPAADTSPDATVLVSVNPDGADRRIHLTFPNADEVVPSPDGRWVAFQEGYNVYLAPFPYQVLAGEPVRMDRRQPELPVTHLSREGGLFPRWRNATTLEFGSGDRFFVHRTDTGETDTINVNLTVPRAMPEGTIALVEGRVVSLNGDEIIEGGSVVARDGRIICVGLCNVAGADRTVNVSGTTIIPGWVDVHAHHHREHAGIVPQRNFESAINLAYGVTTTLDNAAWSPAVFTEAELIEVGRAVGPRSFSSGDPLRAGDSERGNELTSYQVAEQEINRLVSWGAINLKQYLQPRREQRQWISDIARHQGLIVSSEGSDLAYNLGMVMDGQTGWEHPMSYMPIYSDVARFFGGARAVYSPTFVVGGPGAWNEEYFWQTEEVWLDDKQRRFLPWRHLIPHTRRRILRPETDYSFPLIAQGMADIIAEGGYGAIGSHGQQHGLGSHWEVWMVASAMTPLDALRVASLHGAHFLGLDGDLGSLEEGKLADLIVLNSNPLDDIRNTLDIRYVMKGGVLYNADTLDELWPDERAFGDYFWIEPEVLIRDDRPVDYWNPKVDDRPRGNPGEVTRW